MNNRGCIRPNKNKWQADIYYSGKRYRPQFDNETDAQRWLFDQNMRIKSGQLPQEPKVAAETTQMTLSVLFNKAYDRYWAGSKNEDDTIYNINMAKDFFGADTLIQDINAGRIDDYIAFMKTKGNSARTINKKLSCVNKSLKFAVRREYLAKLPTVERLPTGNSSRLRWLDYNEEATILEYCETKGYYEFADWFCFSLDTGARPGEVRAINFERDVRQCPKLKRWVIDIKDPKSTNDTTKPRTIPLTDRALTALSMQQAREGCNEFPFYAWDTGKYRTIWDNIRNYMGESNSPDYVPYMTRHTCATRLAQNVPNIKVVQEWLGHKHIETTMKYVKLVPEDLLLGVSALTKQLTT